MARALTRPAKCVAFYVATLLTQSTAIAQCSIVETLVKSFFPQLISEDTIRSFGQITTPTLDQQLLDGEQKLLAIKQRVAITASVFLIVGL